MNKLILAATVAVLVFVPRSADAAFGDNAVGMNAHIPANSVIDLVADSGAKWIRVDNNWFQNTNPCSATIGWFAPLDAAVTYAVSKGLKVYMTLAYTPACASTGNGDGMSNLNDVPMAAMYGSYVRQAVAHYRAMGVTHFGLWNEANLEGFFEGTAAQYVANVVTPGLAAVTAGCSDAGQSDCLSLGPDLAHVGDYDVFLEDTLNAMTTGGLSFDILAHHSYNGFDVAVWDGDSFLNALEQRRFTFTRRSLMDVLTDTGYAVGGVPTIEIWITETGYQASPATDTAEMAKQESHYMNVIDFQLARSWYTNTFFYEILDSGDTLDGFGCTRNDGVGGYMLKPAYLALKTRIANEPALNGSGNTQCSDQTDNDGDTKIDLADPGCADGNDDDESDDPLPPQPKQLVSLPAPAITIDGDVSEWTSAVWQTVTSPEDFVSATNAPGDAADLSARFASAWTGSTLYLAIEVTDDTHHNAEAAADMWMADSVQVAFDMGANGGMGYDLTDDFELGWARSNAGTVLAHRWHAPSAAGASTSTQAVSRTGSTTTYEIAIPITDLGMTSVSEGGRFGFTVVVNDSDGAAREGFIEWTPGIGQFKRPSEYGVLAIYSMAPPDAGPGGFDAGAGSDGGSPGPDAGNGGSGDGDGGGCGCDTSGNASGWLLGLLMLAAVFTRRRYWGRT